MVTVALYNNNNQVGTQSKLKIKAISRINQSLIKYLFFFFCTKATMLKKAKKKIKRRNTDTIANNSEKSATKMTLALEPTTINNYEAPISLVQDADSDQF
jgi:hypothetical protein